MDLLLFNLFPLSKMFCTDVFVLMEWVLYETKEAKSQMDAFKYL